MSCLCASYIMCITFVEIVRDLLMPRLLGLRCLKWGFSTLLRNEGPNPVVFKNKRVDDHCLFWIKGPKKNKGAFSQGTLQQTQLDWLEDHHIFDRRYTDIHLQMLKYPIAVLLFKGISRSAARIQLHHVRTCQTPRLRHLRLFDPVHHPGGRVIGFLASSWQLATGILHKKITVFCWFFARNPVIADGMLNNFNISWVLMKNASRWWFKKN